MLVEGRSKTFGGEQRCRAGRRARGERCREEQPGEKGVRQRTLEGRQEAKQLTSSESSPSHLLTPPVPPARRQLEQQAEQWIDEAALPTRAHQLPPPAHNFSLKLETRRSAQRSDFISVSGSSILVPCSSSSSSAPSQLWGGWGVGDTAFDNRVDSWGTRA